MEPSAATSDSLPLRPVNFRPLRLGFIQLTDAAPLIVAAEGGLFAKLGLEVELSRELGWGSIQDRLALGELDYIHALGPMPLSASLGLDGLPVDSLGIMPLSYNGNGITLTRKWWDAGIRTSEDFADFVRQEKWRQRFTLGVVAPASSHHFILRSWLRSVGLKPDRDLEIVNLPPGQFLRNLQAHTIDGACVGEPWNTLAAAEGLGWRVESLPGVPANLMEKTLMTTRRLYDESPDIAARVVAALIIAQRWCQTPALVESISRLLAQSSYLRLPARVIAASLDPEHVLSRGQPRTGLHFGNTDLPEFEESHLRWLEEGLIECGRLDKNVSGGRFGLFRYYPPAVVKNAQPYVKALGSAVFDGFAHAASSAENAS